MRLRKKWWARPEMESSRLTVVKPQEYKGKWREEFKNSQDIYLELGCGRGRFLCDNASNNKDINYIGIDLKDEVLIYALRRAIDMEMENVRIVPMNINNIEEVFDRDEISRIYVNFCNPWPKERHKKRRLTHTRLLEKYKIFLKPEGEIWFKTDNLELFNESQNYFKESGFNIQYLTYDLHKSNFKGNITTEYEQKFIGLGMKIMFLIVKML
ncbi:MAG: tRNA (guanosine(46)-N7)-methyltransferase TrmB [Clostridium tyrobutyricum]|jgi:tRNA (guanine-N7-)-methyltransferase|uniref:tRNA (guanosine(46)-N7)-methyltransferase TrmB n=1 Tax=Clostridium tyrobutyricum TaxID=1519 RepID=UPI00073D9286|nr:tRNA (guanosine(46)-N7)-methyltransferase TrmB [Clostridium tyrobutyricum]MBV4446661.1 tRNA (guanosine(46)-N7)-methyltransferase TrmB [Clostridium tyrobutyricum]MCH4201101.1 tRNA (guanosine(46)-N7)-methyltransferase TrmB [Clostridium tyrobutyricum]MCH4238032.1 tRNA (guanosine(46)-N7)-methyltransferase TrmB [Clostridium tyrobutyricum]MCH4257768.1 tRNA (guanosine(46)-N7)-methyltransferase TrmB [Clostridium tyrobutyricum]MCI1238773.1 tRNA (guanosine(46)-N7)-methyltransferase TrmB [Clostridium 